MKKPGCDAFSEAKDDFIMAIVRDGTIGEAATKIAVTLAIGFANRAAFEERGELTAWPSMRLLAQETRLFRSRIDRALKALEAAGHLVIARPEKRGAKHHNRYTLVGANVRTSAAIKSPSIGRTDVANSIGRIDAAIDAPQLAAPARTILAAPVGPNSLEEPLEGAGALNARPAPVQDRDGYSSKDTNPDAQDERALWGLEGPQGAHAADPVSEIAADIEPPETRPFVISEGQVEPRGQAIQFDRGDDPYPSEPVTLADLERLAAEEAEPRAPYEAAEDRLAAIWGDPEVNLRRHTEDAVEGLSSGCQLSLARFRNDMKELLEGAFPLNRRDFLATHMEIIQDLIAEVGGGRSYAENVVDAFVNADGEKLVGGLNG